MKKYENLYINGQWIQATGDNFTSVINPATEEVIATTHNASEDDVTMAIASAKEAFKTWSQTSSEERAKYIKALAEKLAEKQNEMGVLISSEQGIPEPFAIQIQAGGPILGMSSFIERTKIMDETEVIGHSTVYKEPIGVCGLINPWNYPLHQLVGKVAPALAAGCTMVVKPSQEAPLNAYLFAELVDEIGLPAGVFNLVAGQGRTVGNMLSSHPDIDMVSFTGSNGAGASVSLAAAPTIKRVCLELGGKSANIITPTAPLQEAVTAGVTSVMFNCGQTCIATTRMLIQQDQYEEAVAIAKAVAESLPVGDPTNHENFMGPMCSEAQKNTVLDYINKGIDEGARLVTGGVEMPEGLNKGFYVKPTIFADVTNDMVIAQEEIFGPVLCIIPYTDIDNAIEIANDSDFGLSGGVWAGDNEEATNIARRIRTDHININGGQHNYEAPFGGYKQSGNGREWGDEGLSEFIEIKSIQSPA